MKSSGKTPAWTEATFWMWGALVAAVLCLALYAVNLALGDVRAGSVLGMAYGIAATALLAGTALFGVRRRTMRLVSKWKLGRSQTWLYFHLYGGGLFLLLVLMHSGFRLPNGTLMWWLWILSLWTAASGLVGRLLQRWIPRVLSSGLSLEVNYERIPELVAEIGHRAEALAATCDSSVRTLFARKLAPAFAAPVRDPVFFLDITGGAHSRLKELEYLEELLPAAEREKLAELERLYRTKREIDAHYTLQQVLRGWIWFHVPPSLVLLALVVVHVFTVLYY